MAITTFISTYTGIVPNRASDSPNNFVQNVYNYLLWIHTTFTPASVEFGEQMNVLRNEVNAYATSANDSKNVAATHATNALSYKDLALIYRNDALAAKLAIDGYVVPTEATYSPATIDAKIANTRLESFLGFNF